MTYVLESQTEFDRLETQSQCKKYDYRKELKNFIPSPGGRTLDAGCGSGIVSRYLASLCLESEVIGCDFSALRVKQAERAAQGLGNLQFKIEDLKDLSFESSSFAAIVCRYVLEHMSHGNCQTVVSEFFRCLRPGGTLFAIDFDGPFLNLWPLTPLLDEGIQKIEQTKGLDLRVGRKIPHLLTQAGFEVQWRIDTIECRGEILADELKLLPEKFATSKDFLATLLGSTTRATQFENEFMQTLSRPGAVLFYNKFIVEGRKLLRIQPVPR